MNDKNSGNGDKDLGTGFENHIKNDHNMWKYLYFLVYLKERDFDDYSGGESYVFEKTLQMVRDLDTHEKVHDIDTGKELKISKHQIDLLWFPQVLNNFQSPLFCYKLFCNQEMQRAWSFMLVAVHILN